MSKKAPLNVIPETLKFYTNKLNGIKKLNMLSVREPSRGENFKVRN